MKNAGKLRALEYLEHILEAIKNIDEYTADMTEVSFLEDRRTQDAVIRNLEIMGEACNNIVKYHSDFASYHQKIPWGFAYEMRNVLAHGYHKVDLEIVWKTIEKDLPPLAEHIVSIKKEEQN